MLIGYESNVLGWILNLITDISLEDKKDHEFNVLTKDPPKHGDQTTNTDSCASGGFASGILKIPGNTRE